MTHSSNGNLSKDMQQEMQTATKLLKNMPWMKKNDITKSNINNTHSSTAQNAAEGKTRFSAVPLSNS